MLKLRRATLAVVLAAAVVALILAAAFIRDARQWAFRPMPGAIAGGLDAREQFLKDQMDLLGRRAGDIEMLVFILLGMSGLYAIVFVLSAHFSAAALSREVERSVAAMQDRVGAALGDLREIKEEAREGLRRPAQPAPDDNAPGLRGKLSALERRIAALAGRTPGRDEPFELFECESALAALSAIAGGEVRAGLAAAYRGLSQAYLARDLNRSSYYLRRALELAPTPEAHYDLACVLAQLGESDAALEELRASLSPPAKGLDKRLLSDLEEGGALYELASTPPFDKAVNDLLLNLSVAG